MMRNRTLFPTTATGLDTGLRPTSESNSGGSPMLKVFYFPPNSNKLLYKEFENIILLLNWAQDNPSYIIDHVHGLPNPY